MPDRLAHARSLLFVPGDRPDRFDKALACGPDAVILDLEDAVRADHKVSARAAVEAWQPLSARGRCLVRVNPPGTAWFADDVRAAAHADAVVLPKAETPADVLAVHEAAGREVRIIALIETPAGLAGSQSLARSAGVIRLAFGNVDLGAFLGVAPSSTLALAHARSLLVLASALADLPAPIDGVTTAIGDPGALARDTAHAVEMGFGGRLVIHPTQVAEVNRVFTPTAAEVAWAREAARAEGAVAVAGQMVDEPVARRARRLLERAAQID